MWTRAELKGKGKASFKANYWKSVLVALALTAAMTGGTAIATSGDSHSADDAYDNATISTQDGATLSATEDKLVIETPDGKVMELGEDGTLISTARPPESGSSATASDPALSISVDEGDVVTTNTGIDIPGILAMPGALVFISLTLLITFALLIVVYAFIMNPLQAGCRGFFTANLNRKAEVRESVGTFDHGYANVVKAMILRDVFTFLWTLLLIIPGIVKSYEYRMIPYLVAENPGMTYKEAFEESKRMMYGNKWKAFVLDLSFIGWWLLSALTLGLLSVFYVSPYHAATSAALYERLRYGGEYPGFAEAAPPIPPTPAHAAPVA